VSDRGRVVHLKTHPCDVRIDRLTAWGNPFVLGKDGKRGECVEMFHEWVLTSERPSAVWIRENAHTLRGRTLGCWCARGDGVTDEDLPWVCHGQVLLHLANREEQ
jgi:hypothetical protein